MDPFQLTIKNYRCFDQRNPATIEIRPGLTAIVGPNNVGKSALLRLFYELRDLWKRLRPQGIFIFLRNDQVGVDVQVAGSPTEMFSLDNTGDMSIEVVLRAPVSETPSCARVMLTHKRAAPSHWTFEPVWNQGAVERRQVNWEEKRPDELRLSGGQQVHVDALVEAGSVLSRMLYIGPFRNAVNQGGQDYFDLSVGTQFISTWQNWKTGPDSSQHDRILQVEKDVGRIFGFSGFQANASQGNRDLQIAYGGHSYGLRNVGSGLAQFLIALGTAAIKQPSFILIDEPELNLHPTLQRDFLLSLARYSEHGVIFGTHSIGLARSVAEHIYSIRQSSTGSVVRDFSATGSYAELVGEMGFNSYRDLGFDRLLLVEGVTEAKTVQQFLRLYGKDHQVVIIPLGGSQMINGRRKNELAELKRITPRVAALVDSERTAEGEALKTDRADFERVCRNDLGFDVHITERRATENYLAAEAIRGELGEGHTALAAYATPPKGWDKNRNWRIASRMTREDLEATDLHAFFERL